MWSSLATHSISCTYLLHLQSQARQNPFETVPFTQGCCKKKTTQKKPPGFFKKSPLKKNNKTHQKTHFLFF